MLTMCVGDICLGSPLESDFSKKSSFDMGFTEKLSLPGEVRDEPILNGPWKLLALLRPGISGN